MKIEFKGSGPGGEADLRSLHQWLADDRALRGGARIVPVPGTERGRMGPSLEAVLAVVSTAVALAEFPLSVAAWRQARGAGTPPSVTVNVVGGEPHQVASVLTALGVPRQTSPGTGVPAPTGSDRADARPDEETRA
ncbi:effector-associated constant component EACC1 [Streptomyces sp. NPDC054784]